MAIRIIRTDDDPVLRKRAKVIESINDRIITLLDDMQETMKDAEGVGLAAPQVGVLKRAMITDIGEGVLEYINPEILESSGEQCEVEGCLSLPDQSGRVIRPERIRVRALNREGDVFELEADDLLSRAICHELDHLNGILFTDRVVEDDEPCEKKDDSNDE